MLLVLYHFSKTTSATSNQLFIDNVTSPFTYNSSTGGIICSTITCNLATTDIQLPTKANVISFNGNILTINGGSLSIRNFNWVLGGTRI